MKRQVIVYTKVASSASGSKRSSNSGAKTSKKRTIDQITKSANITTPPSSSSAQSAISSKKMKKVPPETGSSSLQVEKTVKMVGGTFVPVYRSALHQWTPAVNKAKSAAIDKKQETFACAVGAAAEEETKGGPKDFKNEILQELGKLLSIYKAQPGEKGKAMGYQRAISNIKTYAKPITSADQMDEIPFVGDGIKKKVREFIEQGKMTKLENIIFAAK